MTAKKKEVIVESREYIQLYEDCLIGNFVPAYHLFLFALKNLKKHTDLPETDKLNDKYREEIEAIEERLNADFSELLKISNKMIFKDDDGRVVVRASSKPSIVNVVIGDAIKGFQPTTNTDIFDILVEFDFFPSRKQARKNFHKARELVKGHNKFEIGKRVLNILVT